jgi:hypothetical protein
MARWRAPAIERLPELRNAIAKAENVMSLWIELYIEFKRAYQEPRNESMIARIYSYADWCAQASRIDDAGRDPLTAVTVAFYEDIPQLQAARDDMPRWFRFNEVLRSKQVFAYSIGETAFNDLLAYMQRNQHRYVERDRSGHSSK